jgi:hypothetical protein
MKFKTIFWLFNAVVLLALLIFALASFFLFGREYAAVYWGNMWIVAVLFILLIGVLDFYFVRNWRLFDYLEQEDWPSLLAWLEDRLYVKGQIRRPYANLLINTALSVSNIDAVKKLETEVRQRRPELMRSLGVSLGIPVLLGQDWKSIGEYFAPLADDPKTHRRDWARWCRALAAGGDVLDEMTELLNEKDPSVRLLSLNAISQYQDQLDDRTVVAAKTAENEVKAALAGDAGERALLRSREDHLMAVVLSGRITEARNDLLSATG